MNANAATRLGMVRCEHCQRQFNPHSAARHIPWCKKQQSDAKKRRLTADKLEALERYRWRIGYRPSNKTLGNRANGAHHEDCDRAGLRTTRSDIGSIGNQCNALRGRKSSSINSSATLSSPSASSLTSISASIASGNGHLAVGAKQEQAAVRKHKQSEPGDRLKRSASTVTLTRRGNGSASSRNSRISTTTTLLGRLDSEERTDSLACAQSKQQTRAKSVSDLTCMGEIVETLAKRMEEIYTQNQLLLATIMRTRRVDDKCAREFNKECDIDTREHDGVRVAEFGDNDDETEFALCHHCRTRCPVEANYCHKCGCKMRPSNPTPPVPD